MDNSELVELVKTNLSHQQLWDSVRSFKLSNSDTWMVNGLPPHKLSNDDEELETEWILPVELQQYNSGNMTLEMADQFFAELKCRRIILGIVNDDGTVVYYFMYKGLHKPKKN
ncbi:LAME_0C04016g1_1 [Lachancea meyersii CBS 8951]|uniref:LAME_0C04016g1_1 n=1 Tax=Lachancea meyersii CBS 8951 TaxID=1266667 RepID=A0A1G4J100_9SACH|nr:LAME_0C04016g1_1 [Lachancea meyersii CBS 8951]